MADIPKTSVSLIATIAGDAQSARWTEFYMRYEGAMRGFLASKFPSLEPEDVIQKAMDALVRGLPRYRYVPDEKGHFRNYLMGVLKHKAMDELAERRRRAKAVAGFANETRAEEDEAVRKQEEADEEAWRESVLEVAIAQLMADETVDAMQRTVFCKIALEHENADKVAHDFGISRENAYVIKHRILGRLSGIVARLTDEARK